MRTIVVLATLAFAVGLALPADAQTFAASANRHDSEFDRASGVTILDEGEEFVDGEGSNFEDECCDECGCGRGKRRGCSRGGRKNQADSFNCGCNGSYKFPVPPLYTYHWPGLYSHQLMTDYHSPWRYPGIRPYEDEKPFQARVEPRMRRASYHQASLDSVTAPVAAEPERISDKMRRYYAD
ncbi:MAG: hypothetical protein DWQ42_14970 [Planctomycetota bacterium]|nr:MAG: hypothetical protein DWQ42_14970 [Planctomycetota bacterium]REK47645.1 MAG: hypothetical protein DWQ46_04250 [Planctomycetota bacterium]